MIIACIGTNIQDSELMSTFRYYHLFHNVIEIKCIIQSKIIVMTSDDLNQCFTQFVDNAYPLLSLAGWIGLLLAFLQPFLCPPGIERHPDRLDRFDCFTRGIDLFSHLD